MVRRWCRSWRLTSGKQRQGKALKAAAQPCELRVSLGGEARRNVGQRRVATGVATRYGGGGPQNRPPPEKPGAGGFRISIFAPDIFCGLATRLASSTNPYHSRYRVTDMLPKVGCLGLSQRQSDNVNHRGRVRADFARSDGYRKQTGTGRRHEKIWRGGGSANHIPSATVDFLSPPPPEG
jgi:hypothetical protein